MADKIKLIVAIEDEIYLDKICDFLETCHYGFVTERYSDKSALITALRVERGYDAILFENDMLAESGFTLENKIKILLSDSDCFQLINGCYSTREYQKTDGIANAVYQICNSDNRFINRETNNADKSKLYLFTSPAGGTGVTTISLSLAIHLAKHGRKTLYINLERFSSIASLLSTDRLTMPEAMCIRPDETQNLSDIVKNEKQIEPTSGLEYFDGIRDLADLAQFSPERLQGSLAQLCASGEYYAIIVDMTLNMDVLSSLPESADKVFLLTRNTNLSIARVNSLLRHVTENAPSHLSKLHVILNTLTGSCNELLTVTPTAVVPMYPMIIDTANFPNAVLHSGAFSRSLSELARQL